MRKALILGVLAFSAAPAFAATSAHCDATPFTLGKNSSAAPREASAQPKPKPPEVKEAVKKPPAKPQAKQRLLANCAGKIKKKSG